jgi:hypothetical protein
VSANRMKSTGIPRKMIGSPMSRFPPPRFLPADAAGPSLPASF